MGKNKAGNAKNSPRKKSGKAKFIILGIIAIVIIGVAAAVTSGADFKARDGSIDTTKGSPVLGSKSAPVTIIEFGDYQCPFCQRWNLDTKPLIEKNYIDAGKVKLIYMDFAFLGPDSIKAHAGSYCADEQGMYWKYHDFIYANQGHENDGWASAENIKSLASKLEGLDAGEFGKCLDSGKYEDRVRENKNIAMRNGASSTPTFIVIGKGEGTQLTGAQPYSVFQALLDEKLTTNPN
ncbi:DsbA family protein [Candidatus Nitrosotenuis chungbukensis]|uniref:DsbA family protein n=1 Tax=Candidatus Nitrosotenuis chungbukensis TaxID=1353246 RepID=UPI0006938745|nr:DsbA family protein [Candidatus Nitrosotenuis chungbukensis]